MSFKYFNFKKTSHSIKNEKGIALFSSLFILALMMIISVSILNSVQKKNEIKNQVNIRLKAANLRYKLLSAINNKANWELTQKNNSKVLLRKPEAIKGTVDATLDPGLDAGTVPLSAKVSNKQSNVSQIGDNSIGIGQPVLEPGVVQPVLEPVIGGISDSIPAFKYPTIDFYDAESGTVVINSKESNSGFTLDGQPCNSFDAVKGDDNCVFKYLITVKSTNFNAAGNPISYMLHSELLYKPRKVKYPFNPKTNFYSFDQLIDYSNGGSNSNLFQDQAQHICEQYGGKYNFKSNTCSKQVTQASSACQPGQTYSGPDKACQTTHLANINCGDGQYMEGFDPTTHLPVCKNY